MLRIVADADVCVGAGQCALVAEQHFDQDDDGIVMVLAEHVDPDDRDVRRAVALCPARAISLRDE